MARDRRRLGGDALHHVAVGREDVGAVVEDIEAGLVEVAGEPALGDREADRIAAARAQRTGRGLDAGGVAIFGVAGGLGGELAELLDVVEADRGVAGRLAMLVDLDRAREMEQRIEQHRGVAARQDEAVAVGPQRRLGVEAQEFGPQRLGDRRQRHRRAGVAAVRLLHRVHRQRADRVDRESVDRTILRHMGALVIAGDLRPDTR